MSSYDANFRKVVSLSELPMNEARVFRAAGATIVLRRTANEVTATGGSDAADAAAGASLPVRVENGEVWVCVEACRPS